MNWRRAGAGTPQSRRPGLTSPVVMSYPGRPSQLLVGFVSHIPAQVSTPRSARRPPRPWPLSPPGANFSASYSRAVLVSESAMKDWDQDPSPPAALCFDDLRVVWPKPNAPCRELLQRLGEPGPGARLHGDGLELRQHGPEGRRPAPGDVRRGRGLASVHTSPGYARGLESHYQKSRRIFFIRSIDRGLAEDWRARLAKFPRQRMVRSTVGIDLVVREAQRVTRYVLRRRGISAHASSRAVTISSSLR